MTVKVERRGRSGVGEGAVVDNGGREKRMGERWRDVARVSLSSPLTENSTKPAGMAFEGGRVGDREEE